MADAENSQQQLLSVVAQLDAILNELPNDADTPNNVIFTYGENWTLVFARGDRAEQTLEGIRKLYKVKLG